MSSVLGVTDLRRVPSQKGFHLDPALLGCLLHEALDNIVPILMFGELDKGSFADDLVDNFVTELHSTHFDNLFHHVAGELVTRQQDEIVGHNLRNLCQTALPIADNVLHNVVSILAL